MENKQKEILSEIRDMMISIRNQMEKLDAKIYEYSQLVEGEEITPLDLDLDLELDFLDDEPEEEIFNEDLPENGFEEVDIQVVEEVTSSFEEEASNVQEMIEEPVQEKRAMIDKMTLHQPWRRDIPGSQVKDIRSAISLNDRVLFINTLFNQDAALFQETITKLNSLNTLDEALNYLYEKFPEWELESEVVYRFMMAVRRRISK